MLDTCNLLVQGPIHSEKAYERSNGKGNGVPLTGVRGGDVKPGEIIDRKFYTGTENRPQEQALGNMVIWSQAPGKSRGFPKCMITQLLIRPFSR